MAINKDRVVAGKKQTRTESTDATPLMVQYRTIKDEYRNEVLFFRLGDFYEMFDEDALDISRLLNLTLTHRGTQPMCGIPFHSAKGYIARLLRYGKKIAICEQVGEPPNGKGIAERKVVEVITPGTALESEYLDGFSNNFLSSLFVRKGKVGFAYLDITTGDFFATSWDEKEMEENFPKELGRAFPKELLLPESLRANSFINDILSLYSNISVSYYQDWNFDISLSYKRLVNQFQTVNLKSFSLTEDSPEVCPAGFLIDYIQKNSFVKVPHVSEIKVYKDYEYLIMDDSSRRNLEINCNLRDGTISYSLLECLSFTQTAMGNRLLRLWLNYPLTNSKMIISRQNHIELFVNNRRLLDVSRQVLSSILDVERLVGRVAMERAHAKDLQALRCSLEKWLEVRKLISEYNFAVTPTDIAENIISLINSSILDDPATSITEGRLIKDGWSAELDRYRDLKNNFDKVLSDYVEEEKRKTGISNLRIKCSNSFGYYLEVTKGKLLQVPEHFILRRSLINADRYTTVQLQELERDLNTAESKIIETERDLYIEIRNKIAQHISYLLQISKEIAYTDVSCSLAQASIVHNWVKPIIDDSFEFVIKDGRHPVVESHIPKGEFVPNNTEIYGGDIDANIENFSTFALITGPNMAGKSTYLRQNALIALLAQIGSYVPASYAKIGVIDRIFCRVGASDNLAKGESTFLVEMTETANILRTATEKSLVIMDEVGRGTSTEDGLSIAWAISEYLLNSIKSKTLFATHYHELTRINHSALRLLCMEVSENSGSVVFLRKVKEGASENSYGIHVAKLAGIPQSVINRASEILLHIQKIAGDKPIIVEELETVTKSNNESLNLTLFSNEEIILNEITSSDPENLTPIQALQLLSRWKETLLNKKNM